MTSLPVNLAKSSQRDRSTSPRQCITAGGETIFFIYPNGRIVPEEMDHLPHQATAEALASELQE
ncbi:hypothetical protein [Trichothermofontia sp.]